MANVKLNPVFEGFSKKIGDLVFFQKNGSTFVRRLGEYTDSKTEDQLEVRTAFTRLVENWKQIPGIFKEAWKAFAKTQKKGTGYNHFIGENATSQRNGELITLFKSHGEEPLQTFTCQFNVATNDCTAAFTPAPLTDKHLTLFCQ